MEIKRKFNVPDEITMLELFGGEPVEARPEDGYWCYQITDSNRITLRLSWSVIEQSLQVSVSTNDYTNAIMSQEGDLDLAPINYKDGRVALKGEFYDDKKSTTVYIYLFPRIQVTWSTLAK